MSLLIKNWQMADWKELLKWAKIGANNAMIGEFTEVEEVPPHGRLIDADKIAEGKFVSVPHVTVNGNEAGMAYRLGWNAAIMREWRKPKEKKWTVEFRRIAYVPQCTDSTCVGRSQKKFQTEEEAAKAWNRRA